ncbi:MAG: Assimilatory nitrate reductase large subunit [Burkholderiaceae bacterium]|jgi:assimilatory nitrate reductase catalytic subunit|nr:MAG: Assimilatory nitrate reductase large subunit [Burkholderiaceae bacterium]
MTETRSTCPYCGVGCGVVIESDGERIVGVRGDPEHPANFGRLCSKGATLHLTVDPAVTRQVRLLAPMQRPRRGDAPQPLSWEAALNIAARRFAREIAEHGPDSIGFYLSGQLLTEDYYVFNKLARGLIGTNNVDSNSRLCMSSAVAAYRQTLGADAPPACYDDIAHAQCLFIAGSNTAWAHPVLFRRIEDARAANPRLRIVVVDPRCTDTAASAHLHLAIQPGTDVMLFHGMLQLMVREGWIARDWIAAHTGGWDALEALLAEHAPERAAQVCGIALADLHAAARLFAGVDAGGGATLSLYCQGLNQSTSGTAKNAALINLHLATGQIGRPGAGPLSLTGQPNAMGGREVGAMATLLGGHRNPADPRHRAEVAALWGVPELPATPGRTAVEMFQAAADGEIRALWIVCTNPAQSMPDQALVRRALERAEFVVVQEAFATTATCAFADLLLPATSWGEKTGTVTNSERRISRVRAAVTAPGQARHDWAIAVDFAHRLAPQLPERLPALSPAHLPARDLFPYPAADFDAAVEAIWNEHRESTRGRDLDITGLSYARLDDYGPQQWPLPQGAAVGTARLYEDGVFPTPDGRARFAAVRYLPVAEPCDARFPIALTTGRLRDQWHGMSRTGTLGRLFGHAPEPALQLHPQDIARRSLAEGDLVHVTSRRGAILLPLQRDDTLAPGQAFVAMHWGEEAVGGRGSRGQRLAGVNALTSAAYCPTSKQPELKHAAVKILKAELPWSLLAMAWIDSDKLLAVREQLKHLFPAFAFASCVPFGSSRGGLLFRAAGYEAADAKLLAAIEALLQLGGPDVLRYADGRRGQRRAARLTRVAGEPRLAAFLLAGDIEAERWLRPLLQDELPAPTDGRLLLAPGARAPAVPASRGRQVCSCRDVGFDAIRGHLAATAGSEDARLASLQAALKCGTECGSCVPELRGLIRAVPAPTAGMSS